MSRRRPRCASLLVLAGLALAGCRTTEAKRPLPATPPVVVRSEASRAWDAVSPTGEVVGSVVHFASEVAPEQAVWVVRNGWGQDLGWVDRLGRAYRLLPHHREPAWVGTGTVLQGVERILRSEGALELRERTLEDAARPLPASSGDS